MIGLVPDKNRSKKGGTIKVNSPSFSRRTFKVQGRGPAPQGSPLQDRSGKVQMVVTEDGEMIARSGRKCQRKWNCPQKTHQAINYIIKIVCKKIEGHKKGVLWNSFLFPLFYLSFMKKLSKGLKIPDKTIIRKNLENLIFLVKSDIFIPKCTEGGGGGGHRFRKYS